MFNQNKKINFVHNFHKTETVHSFILCCGKYLTLSFILLFCLILFSNVSKGGRELPDDIRQKVQSDGSLVISPVQKKDDSGVYTCWARNKQGHSARRSGEVSVIGKNMKWQ